MEQETVDCAKCGETVSTLATFPGGICLDCYKQTPDARRPLSAEDVRGMWGVR